MKHRERLGLGALLAFVVAAPIVAGVAVYRAVPEAHAAGTPWYSLAADSSHGDSAAFASLPAGLMALLDVRDAIADGRGTLSLYECIQMDGEESHDLRRRLQMRFADSSAAVLYVVADRHSGTLERVEFLRRTPSAGQRGFIWDRTRDRTTSAWWFESPRGLARRDERGTIPRGSPVPRTVRALGRQLLTVPCADSSANSPTNPISGSRN
ncbi:MAG: hypothetical protein K8S21_08375 [Gemmatimonadetes bacterium]|nr:hypothetical protein [Gemmatimonadota bacterium]